MDSPHPTADVVIEVPAGSFIKRRPDGSTDFVSPLPCPFNYGSVVGSLAADGDPQDALVLGPAMQAGQRCTVRVWERVRFEDNGAIDDKWICGASPPTENDRKRITRFFTFYVWAKRALNQLRGRKGPTQFHGLAPVGLMSGPDGAKLG